MKQFSKYQLILLALYITAILATVSMAHRIISLGPLNEAGGIFVFPLIFPILDIMGEVYGYSYPRFFIWLGVVCQFFFSLYCLAIVSMPFPEFFTEAAAYESVFHPTFRYVLAGLAGIILGEFINVYLLAKWKIKLAGRYFILRSFISTAIGQASVSIVVIFCMFFGKLNLADMTHLMFSGWIMKVAFAAVYVIPAWFVVDFLRKKEKVDYYDTTTNFNPFKWS